MLDIGRIRTLRGRNIWAERPVIEFTLTLGDAPPPSAGLMDRLAHWTPPSAETTLAAILARLTLALQTQAGCQVAFWDTRPAESAGQTAGVYRVACEYDEPAVALACLDSARALLVAALRDEAFDAAGDTARLRALCQDLHLGPSTSAIARAAQARGIPVQRVGRDNLLLLGQGVRQRRVWTAETDRTGAIAEAIAQDKDLTRLLLGSVGVPVPEGRPVASPREAWVAAQALGLPVVIKPRFGNHGRGISTDLRTQAQVERAFAAALAEAPEILCERHIPGADHRLLVVGERMVAAALREPAQVIGDGVASVRELVDRANADPRRSEGHATVLSRIKLDAIGLAVLAEQGLAPDAIPPAGARVLIRSTANLSTGGTATDITERVHPQVAARAVDAARAVGLDIAGVDVLARDIGLPLEEQGGAVVEVNAGPGLRMHLDPSAGAARPVGEAIVELLFAPGDNGRIPVAAVNGGGDPALSKLLASILRAHRTGVALANREGRFLDGRRLGNCLGAADGADASFLNPLVEIAVVEVRAEEILRRGLGLDGCRVCVVAEVVAAETGVTAEDGALLLPEDWSQAHHCLVQGTAADGVVVLNAEDPEVSVLAGACRAPIVWFARDARHATVSAHRAQGGRAVIARGSQILLATGAREEPLPSPAPLGRAAAGRPRPSGGDLLAAVAAAWALGVPAAGIHAGLTASDWAF